jgi:hypothetical protein
MSSVKTDNRRPDYFAKGGSIPETTLNIPMPAGAKPPPAAPAAKPSTGGNKGK